MEVLLSTQAGPAEPLQQEVHEHNKENKRSPTIPSADCGHTEKLLFLQATRALKNLREPNRGAKEPRV
ncbi:hypothetical protein EYF80_012007 [Liparis tanakae]|uniref:Uncharacterized protein n=1 Tax=Liparis tanakae TaxID=230148 RepID=A0A4Z2II71_9TELE|nr:hypothetical protein EYF80_012007 [Liparis tanakae]